MVATVSYKYLQCSPGHSSESPTLTPPTSYSATVRSIAMTYNTITEAITTDHREVRMVICLGAFSLRTMALDRSLDTMMNMNAPNNKEMQMHKLVGLVSLRGKLLATRLARNSSCTPYSKNTWERRANKWQQKTVQTTR